MKRKVRTRSKIVAGGERPRLAVFKSARHLYAQIIDDAAGKTLASCSTLDKALKGKVKATVDGAKAIGKTLAERALSKGVHAVIFDRSGFHYHGQLKALADAAREAGLKF